jgi:hypothetical protein
MVSWKKNVPWVALAEAVPAKVTSPSAASTAQTRFSAPMASKRANRSSLPSVRAASMRRYVSRINPRRAEPVARDDPPLCAGKVKACSDDRNLSPGLVIRNPSPVGPAGVKD